MQGQLITIAELRLHARPTTAEEAEAALEWLAAREGKTLDELIGELAAVGETETHT